MVTPELKPSLGSENPSCLWGIFSFQRLIMGILPTGLHRPERWERRGFPPHFSRRKRKLGQVSCPGFSVSIWQVGLAQASGLPSENSFCLPILLGLDCLTPASLAFCSVEAPWLVKSRSREPLDLSTLRRWNSLCLYHPYPRFPAFMVPLSTPPPPLPHQGFCKRWLSS